MKIAINGAGVAGPALAWWLRHYGHQPVLFEKAPALRTGGYIIDFWGVGYDVAEKMGILPALYEKGYIIRSLRMVNRSGKKVAGLDVSGFRKLIKERFVSIARSDISATIYHACAGVETRFGNSIVGIEERPGGVIVRAADGSEELFDLAIGADGLHSQVRGIVFGPEKQFEHYLGYYVAAFTLAGYEKRDELAYISYTVPQRQVARVSLRDDRTMFFLMFRHDLMEPPPTVPQQKAMVRQVFGKMEWEVPQILARMDEAEDFYFDRVSQIKMEKWSKGRVALLGDAAACVSFLAGEGTGLAITEAYILAGELHRAGGDHAAAFARYEEKLRPFLVRKQKSALGFAGFFAPKNAWGLFLRDLAMNAAAIPLLGSWTIGLAMRRALRDDFTLPNYGD